ncbi:MAG TPA: cyanophycin synthetase [Candidatus Saccharimonadales bacterium]|nr:cyanophycin synthetase [Candidatus Saccharimonadales bacterium]
METLKKILYFPIASYFKFFAQIRLRKWNPKIVVVTGSSGKTTLLHLIESQIGERARFSHHANSSYGIPFDILDLHRETLQPSEWLTLFLQAPSAAFRASPKENIYVVEADCDRPGEGKFLSELLRPDIVLWLNVSRTHSMNFDELVSQKRFANVDEAIAYEFGYFVENCSQVAMINGDLQLEINQEKRTKTTIVEVTKEKYLDSYKINERETTFTIQQQRYSFDALLPQDVFYSIAMCKAAIKSLGLEFDPTFKKLVLPPGRSTVFHGIKSTTLIDSSYNANLESIKAMLSMFAEIFEKKKWVVLGDMLELGKEEKDEHEKLAELLAKFSFERIILIGPRMEKYTYPQLDKMTKKTKHINFYPKGQRKIVILDMQRELTGGEVVLFKGSQSLLLEGIIEELLENKKDSNKLPRREQIWKDKRAKLLD